MTIDYTEFNKEIQSIFASLDEVVKLSCPAVSISSGWNSSQSLEDLFCYRRYTLPKIDAVVVGIFFLDNHIKGDITGELLGDILYEAKIRECSDPLGIANTAKYIAEELSQKADIVVSALQNTARFV